MVVLHSFSQNREAVNLACEPRADGSTSGIARCHDQFGGFGCGVGCGLFHHRQVLVQKLSALPERMRIRKHFSDAAHLRSRQPQQVKLNRHDHFTLDEQVGFKCQHIQCGIHRAFYGVLNRSKRQRHISPLGAHQSIGYRRHSAVLGGGQVALREQGLLGESARRPEVCHLADVCVHLRIFRRFCHSANSIFGNAALSRHY